MSVSPCPNNERGCPYFEVGCYADTHHVAWPKPDYTTPLEKTYRDLDENKIQLCRFDHDMEHEMPPPEKPSREHMQQAIDRAVHVGSVALSRNQERRIYG